MDFSFLQLVFHSFLAKKSIQINFKWLNGLSSTRLTCSRVSFLSSLLSSSSSAPSCCCVCTLRLRDMLDWVARARLVVRGNIANFQFSLFSSLDTLSIFSYYFSFHSSSVSCARYVWSRFSLICALRVVSLFYNRARWETEQLKISRIFDVVVCLINPSDRRATSLISFSRTYWFRLWRRRESCSFNWKGQWISSALINDLSLRLIFYL